MVLFTEMVAITLSQIRLNKLWIKFNALLRVLQCLIHDHELDVGGASVRVNCDRFWITAQAFVVFFDSTREIALLKQLITLLSMLLRLLWIEVSFRLGILFRLLCLLEGHLDYMALVFQQCFLICINTLVIHFQLQLRISLPSKRLRHLDVIVSLALDGLDAVVAPLNTLLEIFHLEIHCSLVRVVGQFFWVLVDSLLIQLDRILKIFLLVKFITLSLKCLCFFCRLNFRSLFFW